MLSIDEETLVQIKNTSFWKFLAKNIPGHYSWGRKISLDDLISFTDSIDEPLFLLPKSLQFLSQNAFRCKNTKK